MTAVVLLCSSIFEGLVPLALIGALTYGAGLVAIGGIDLRDVGSAAGAWLHRDAGAETSIA
jgi:hypothetical protein